MTNTPRPHRTTHREQAVKRDICGWKKVPHHHPEGLLLLLSWCVSHCPVFEYITTTLHPWHKSNQHFSSFGIYNIDTPGHHDDRGTEHNNSLYDILIGSHQIESSTNWKSNPSSYTYQHAMQSKVQNHQVLHLILDLDQAYYCIIAAAAVIWFVRVELFDGCVQYRRSDVIYLSRYVNIMQHQHCTQWHSRERLKIKMEFIQIPVKAKSSVVLAPSINQ